MKVTNNDYLINEFIDTEEYMEGKPKRDLEATENDQMNTKMQRESRKVDYACISARVLTKCLVLRDPDAPINFLKSRSGQGAK